VWHDWEVSESLAGKLLIASPRLVDPNFDRTVVLILQDDEEGTVGVVLNRPTTEKIEDHLPEWSARAARPGLVHYGGPVAPQTAIGVGGGAEGMAVGVPGLGLIDLGNSPADDGPPVRVYSGYAGWGQGQLSDELTMGSWYVVQAAPDDPFDAPEGMWRRVLRRQAGSLALVSTYPDHVELN